MTRRLDGIVATVLLAAALLCIVFIDALVAPPKMLLGRALTAIEPSLFPLIILTALAGLCALFLLALRKQTSAGEAVEDWGDWSRISGFFAILVAYALLFEPIGFLLSTALAITALSWLAGNRAILQIISLAVVSPVILYIVSTRLLLVSLPELSSIEFAYAAVLPGG